VSSVSSEEPAAAAPVRDQVPDTQEGKEPIAWDAGPQPIDLHAQLARRIAHLQNERQNRWQRLVGLVTGQRSGG
jgi:hypothetical protein